MDFNKLVNKRYSHRGYLDKEVENEKISYIINCANLAPSCANRQPWKIYVVKNPEIRAKLVKAYPREWFAESPIIIVVTGMEGENWVRQDGADYLMCDATIIADYFILAASEMELGTCYIAAFDEGIVRDALGLKSNEKPFFLTPLGYPKEGVTRERKRKQINEIVEFI
jgi:nitroreductase